MVGVQSFIVGISGLLFAFCVSACLVFRRPGTRQWETRALYPVLPLSLLAQTVHFAEEAGTGFHIRFPELLGLPAWPMPLFLAFNLLLLAIWTWGMTSSRRHRFYATVYWFLALASILNGVAHPTFSILVGGYFPGLYSSPIVGVLGILLFSRLHRATDNVNASSK